jgi:porin
MNALPVERPRHCRVAVGVDGQRRLRNPVRSAETAIELTFLAPAARWLALQPDIQYVIAPNTSSLKNALALQLRFELTL